MEVHEAPVWLPDTNTVIVSPLPESHQLVIDLNSDPVFHVMVLADPSQLSTISPQVHRSME